jgi:hypothetical protein
MNLSKIDSIKIGAACLFVNGVILLFYALLVPAFVQGVHWLITLVAILFIVAIPAIYHSIRRVHRVAARVVAVLFAFAMVAIIVSDLLFASSSLTAFGHNLSYALGNALFVISVLIIGLVTLKGGFYKWVAYLSIITGVVGLATYLPQASGPLATFSLLLLGLWALAVGFNIRKLSK